MSTKFQSLHCLTAITAVSVLANVAGAQQLEEIIVTATHREESLQNKECDQCEGQSTFKCPDIVRRMEPYSDNLAINDRVWSVFLERVVSEVPIAHSVHPIIRICFGHSVGNSLAMALIEPDLATPGTDLSAHVVGVERGAKVIDPSPYDPEGKAMRA